MTHHEHHAHHQPDTGQAGTVRRARQDDIAELVRLRALLCETLHRRGRRLAACGIGTVERWFPGPHHRNGSVGHVISLYRRP
ncbi:hypothetical protein [Streptomyces sp. NPDC001657]|uniref:hypothetical protein n=1 Tax=Streptomyces sp. NPDC001657 TaxID=3154522 RepID=UPI003326283A